MNATGATLTRPSPIRVPRSSPKPVTTATRIGSAVSAISTETRRDSTATRNRAMVTNPLAASIVALLVAASSGPSTQRAERAKQLEWSKDPVAVYRAQASISDRLMIRAHGPDHPAVAGGPRRARRRQLHRGRRGATEGAVVPVQDRAGSRAPVGRGGDRAHKK